MSQDLNKTMNGTQPSSCYWNPTAAKIGITFAYCLIFIVSLAGNTVIGIIVYKTKTMRKPINLLIVNMAMSDLLVPIFSIPRNIQLLYTRSWLIVGPLGEALCKLVYFLRSVSFAVSIQSLVLIAVHRFGAVVYPLRSPLISSKLCPFFILATWIIAMAINSPYLFAMKLVEYSEGLFCRPHWKEAFGESSSFKNYFVSFSVTFLFIPLLLITILYITIYRKLHLQKNRPTLDNNASKGKQCVKDVNCYCIRVCSLLAALCYILVSRLFCIGHMVLWLRILFDVADFMIGINCCMNPCICFIFSRNYRLGLKTLLFKTAE